MKADLLASAMGIPTERAERWAESIGATCATFGIDTTARLAAFLAQVGHESMGLYYVREIWGPTPAQRRYEGRADLGNTQPGDGKRYMGRGLIQVTGRANYAMTRDQLRLRTADVPDFELLPELLEWPRWAALSAGAFWDRKLLNSLADSGDFLRMSIRINGKNKDGFPNGWKDRQQRHQRALRALNQGAE